MTVIYLLCVIFNFMNKNSTNAISPIDGRYSNQTKHLSEFFSEKALIKYRLKVEVEYFIKLTLTGIDRLKNWNVKNNSSFLSFHLSAIVKMPLGNLGPAMFTGHWPVYRYR